jgi:hypothetical protein
MLTKRQNFLETIRGGNPDRFVKQYEALGLVMGVPSTGSKPGPGEEAVNAWGVTYSWPEGQVAAFPVHDEEHIVLKDVTKWRDYVKAPPVKFPEEAWAPAMEAAAKIDRNEQFVTCFVAPGLFEQCHHLMSMEEALMAFYEEPEAMHELIEYFTEYELAYAKELIDHIHPDAIFHHDDWGSNSNSFLSPEMFEEFFVPYYKRIYGFYKENGVEVIVHHSDSYAANLVPHMIEMGIDVWQGAVANNNIPELIKEYGGKISFMAGIDNNIIDFPDWNRELIAPIVEKACKECGKHYFIPSITRGLNFSLFPGAYEVISEEIDRMSKEMF